MKFRVIVDAQFFPENQNLQSAFAKGALTRHIGNPRSDNPYKKFQGGFLNCWDRGWALVDTGHVTVELDIEDLLASAAKKQ